MRPVWRTAAGPGGYLGGILGSTAYDGERIYGPDTLDGRVFALGRDGSVLWTSFDAPALHLAPTAIAHGVLYTVDPVGTVVARDPATGAVLSRLSLGRPSFGGVSAVGGALYVAVGTGRAFEPAPQQDFPGSIVAFGDTSRSGAQGGAETAHASAAPRSGRIRLSVRPRRVSAHRRVRLRFRARSGSRPLRGVRIRVAGRGARTDRRGRAALSVRFERSGVRVVRARRRGLRAGRARIRVM
jgi:hypothetical protein